MTFKEKLLTLPIIKEWKSKQQEKKFKGSGQYWEERYKSQGNSGSGSYDHLAEFKAEFLNNFVLQNNIQTVIELGCGDGNQLKLARYPVYLGLDISPTAVNICYNLFKADQTKSFYVYDTKAFYDNAGIFKSELSLSLDVLYHLVEKEIFEKYLQHLFAAAERYVIIYASDFNQDKEPMFKHENRRSFTDFVEKNIKGWKLKELVKNKYSIEEFGLKGSHSDFFIYEKI